MIVIYEHSEWRRIPAFDISTGFDNEVPILNESLWRKRPGDLRRLSRVFRIPADAATPQAVARVSWSALAFRVTQETCSLAASAFRSSTPQSGDAIQVGPYCGLGVWA